MLLNPAYAVRRILRLVVLMIEVEQPEGVSTRKLVLETARHNVISAYSTDAGLKLLRRFPNVEVVVVHTELDDYSFEETVRKIKNIRNDVSVIGISPRSDRDKGGADYMLSSHDPHALLQLLAERFEATTSDLGDE
jgi:DNA-binding NtrC family response regulator